METARQDQAKRVGLSEGGRERETSRVSPAETRCSDYIVGGSQPDGFTTYPQTLPTQGVVSSVSPQKVLPDSSRCLR